MLLNSLLSPSFFSKLAAQVLLKIKVSVEPCLVSIVVLMRGCSGTDEYEAGKGKKNHSILTTKNLDYTTEYNPPVSNKNKHTKNT